jgi:hypothetical protein
MTRRNEAERNALLLTKSTSVCISLYSDHRAALAARKRLYRLGARALGYSVLVRGCEVHLIKTGPLTITSLP